jgi:hypothetical protein
LYFLYSAEDLKNSGVGDTGPGAWFCFGFARYITQNFYEMKEQNYLWRKN